MGGIICDPARESEHEAGFAIRQAYDRPYFTIMCFHTPFQVMTANGMELGNPGDCVINTPTFPEVHMGVGGKGFSNTWLHVRGAGRAVSAVSEKYGLPLNAVIPTENRPLICRYLHAINAELASRSPFTDDLVEIAFELLLITIAKANFAYRTSHIKLSVYVERIEQIRLAMTEHCEYDWSVERMAAQLPLSCSRFSTIYKHIYGKSPIDDLLGIRLQRAKELLLNTGLTVAQVAERCGFLSVPYFSRCFKSKCGIPPSRFRFN